jgi:hypothetical protein
MSDSTVSATHRYRKQSASAGFVGYPELSAKMAMKIGGEYSADRVSGRDFEKLAEEAGLARALARRRVPELAASVIEGLRKVDIKHAPDVVKTIEKRSRGALERFAA